MGLHHERNHGRVLRGTEARKHLEMTKRDSHGSDIKMHVPEGFADKQEANDGGDVATVYNVVYVTASADFTGATAGYTTVTGDSAPTSTVTAVGSTSTQTADADEFSAAAVSSTTAAAGSSYSVATSPTATSVARISSSGSSSSSVINNKSMFLNPPASATAAASTVAAAAVAGTPLSATRTPGAQISNTSSGMNGGAKAGLAFGIIIGFALVAGLLFFCWRRRKNPNAHEELDEKRTSSIFGGKAPEHDNRTSVAPSVRSTRTASTAPRLSLRPVTQFLPNLGENRKSAGNLLGIGGTAPMSEKPKSAWERRPVGTENPFDDNNEKHDRTVSPPANPFDEPEGAVVANGNRSSTNSSEGSTHSKNGSVTGSEPTTPKSNVNAAAAVSATSQNANNVHRVQLDFKPSMEDELELKSGQLVRMLHAYDDGWALCVRMDRSQQGVAPRTCLSKLPVKPRPQGPPNGQRGAPPPGMRGPGMVPRPLSPASRERSGSAASESPRTSPSSGSNQLPAVARKPVPGQAL